MCYSDYMIFIMTLLSILLFQIDPTLVMLPFIYGFVHELLSNKKTRIKPANCKPHAWIYKNEDTEQEYMVCDSCGRLPNGSQEEDDNGIY